MKMKIVEDGIICKSQIALRHVLQTGVYAVSDLEKRYPIRHISHGEYFVPWEVIEIRKKIIEEKINDFNYRVDVLEHLLEQKPCTRGD